MSEELYLKYEMKYRDHMNRKVDEKVREHDHEIAKKLFAKKYTIDDVMEITGLPRDDLLRMQAELNGTPA